MKRINILFIFIFVISVSAFSSPVNKKSINTSKNTGITGKITDKQNNESLSGVIVELVESGEKAYTDFEGNFTFNNLEPGIYRINATLISYRKITTQIIVSLSGNNYLTLELEQDLP